jgi:hypothetical protein
MKDVKEKSLFRGERNLRMSQCTSRDVFSNRLLRIVVFDLVSGSLCNCDARDRDER